MLLSRPDLRRPPVLLSSTFAAVLLVSLIWGVRPAPADEAVHATDVVVAHPLVSERAARMAASEWIQAGLGQTETIEFVKVRLAAAGLPADLAGVPLVESGYRNLGPEANKYVDTAGIWQFIPPTARTYGLTVSADGDERRDLPKSTDAALRLLSDLHDEFDDWGLALAAYNVGSKKVRAQVKHHGTDDVLALIQADALPTYAADVMAAAHVLRVGGRIE